jgi:zinc protease
VKKFILLADKGSPVVYLNLAFTRGSVMDPPGKPGVASLMLSLMLRGTTARPAAEFHRALDNLGAEIHLGKFKESMRIYGTVLADKLDKFLDLLEEMLTAPAFADEEFRKLKDQFRSSLLDELGDDGEIADRRFQEYMLHGHPYGSSTSGSLTSIDKIEIADLRAFYRANLRAPHAVWAAAGGFEPKKLQARLEKILARLPQEESPSRELVEPTVLTGRNLVILNKPGRTQSQIYIGGQGIGYHSPDYLPLALANHVFGGGSFSARLMTEVRVKRGWSYGTHSYFRASRLPLYWGMDAVPSNKDTAPAVALMIKLYEKFHKNGISKTEFDFAKTSLVNQSAFLQDTLRKRMENKVAEAVLGLPKGYYDGYSKRLRALRYSQVQNAIKKHVNPKNLLILVLCSDELIGSELKSLKGLKSIHVRSFDEEPKPLLTQSS